MGEQLNKFTELLKSQHSRFECFDCSEPPTHDIRWAEGMARCWFCDEHYEKFKNKNDGWNDIDSHHVLCGEAPEKWNDYVPKKDIQKQEGGGDSGGFVTTDSNVFTSTFGLWPDRKKKKLNEFVETLNKQHTIPETMVGRPRIESIPHRDRSKLIKRKVPIKTAKGIIWGTRWVKIGSNNQQKKPKKYDTLSPTKIKDDNKIDYKGGIITLIPPQNIKDKLYIDGGEKKEDMHIALAYLPYPWNSNVVEIISNFSLPPSIGKLTGKLEKFGAKEEDKFAIVATIEIHGIDEWRNMFIPVMEEKRLIVSNNFPIFIPHVTLKYIGKDEELPQKEIPQEDFEFDRLEVWDKDKRTVIKDFTKDVEKSNWNNEIQEIKKMDLVDRINWWKINKSIISSNEEKLNYYINAFKN